MPFSNALLCLYASSLQIAQLISQVSSHFIIHYQRRVLGAAQDSWKRRHQNVDKSESCDGGEQKSVATSQDISFLKNEDANNDEKECLHDHQFSRPHRVEDERLVARTWINKSLWIASFCLVSLVIIGCTLPSFSLEILGIIGVAVESGQGFEDAVTQHSVFTVIKLLFEEARFLGTVGDYIGLGTLSMLLVFSVLLVPMVQCFALLRQWLSPSTRKERARMSIFIEILQAWQYAEVYLIAIFVASW
jgi:uncharacterized membrane protein